MASYSAVVDNPFNMNKAKFPGMERAKTYSMSQYLFNTFGLEQYPGPLISPYLNQVDGSTLQVSLLPTLRGIGTNRFISRTGARARPFNFPAASPEGLAALAHNAQPGVAPIRFAMTEPELDALPWAAPDQINDHPEANPTARDVRIFAKPVCNQESGIRSNLGRIARTPRGLEHRELRAPEIVGRDFNFPELHSFLDGGPPEFMGRFIKFGVLVRISNPTPALTGRWSVCVNNGRQLVSNQFFENRYPHARSTQKAIGESARI